MQTNYQSRTISATIWWRYRQHTHILDNRKHSTPMRCRDNLMWWYLLHNSTYVRLDILHPHICWWCYFSVDIFPYYKRETMPYTTYSLRYSVILPADIILTFLPEKLVQCNPQCSYVHISNCNYRVVFSLRKGNLEKDLGMRVTNWI